ncbi:TlpA family protein disulfide reductase [Lutibacter sp. A80]|uniref:TlpA family protein disulfide reductase n=1 Tax=Lutibacter sp. A80 TaxID=2918453 RepID=UPI001F056E2F|nr:TlpA disulfide reductase family protein [Lutibacter sp. A80]UMB60835.1 TlpA family protein disulfide reductase [Lutibacter sp. A80]
MKFKSVLLVLTFFAFLTSCKESEKKIEQVVVNSNEFKVFGTLQGIDVPYMFIDYTGENGDRVWDTLYVKNEYFSYTTELKNTKRIAIWPLLARPRKDGEGVKGGYFEFLAHPGDTIEFKGNVTETFNAIPTGTSLCNDLNTYNKSIEPINKQSAEMFKRATKYKPTNPKFKQTFDSIKEIGEKITKIQADFIKNNPTSEVAAFYLSNMVQSKSIENNEALALLNNFDEKLAMSPFYINVATRLKGSEATKAGNIVPELITKRTLDGSEFDLKSLRGKYVLIDFWGTWCGPCVSEMPKVKKYQEKYKDKLVIVGIDSGDTKERIVEFITSKGYNWTQLMSHKGLIADDFVSKFNVNGFPTKFIIDPEGIIVGKYVGGSEEAFQLLDELLNI